MDNTNKDLLDDNDLDTVSGGNWSAEARVYEMLLSTIAEVTKASAAIAQAAARGA